MEALCFEWDPAKAESNAKKHEVTFTEALTVFYDELARVISDPDSSALEERFIILDRVKRKDCWSFATELKSRLSG